MCETAACLANNVIEIRRRRQWSQAQLSDRSGIPRSTIANIETGAGNPSLRNLVRLATALGIGIDELLARPRSDCQLIRAPDVPVRRRGQGRVLIHKLLPERVRGMEIDRMEFSAGASMGGTPHIAGTKEYLCCIDGQMQVRVAGRLFELASGDVLAFPGDQRHSYRNPAGRPASAVSVVAPVSAATTD